MKALVTESALQRLERSEYRFCPNAACQTVYFADSGRTIFSRIDVRVPVWQKEPPGARMICYCFGENEASIREEVERAGSAEAVRRVRDHIAADRCACDIRNPRGACCLSDLIATVNQAEAHLQQTR